MGGFLSHAESECFELAEYSQDTIVRLNGALPSSMYHYTSYDGVISILESGVLRLGNLEWMDDKTEVAHAASAFRTQLDKLYLIQEVEPRGKELLASMRRELN
jgi:hypothetical protein